MKSRRAIWCIFLMLVMLLCAISVEAASVYSRPKKSVYLVLDDSGSMIGSPNADANYALQTFLATMDKDDEVNIYFLNAGSVYNRVDISQKSDAFLENIRKNYPNADNGTPFAVVSQAAEELKHSVDKDSDKEYWLVIVTDGEFTSETDWQGYLNLFTTTPLKNGAYPHVLFLGIADPGRSVIVPEIPAGAENRFFVESEQNMITAMNKATRDISNRQEVRASNADANTLEFELAYPVRNIVVLAQNKQTRVLSADCASTLRLDETYHVQYPVNNPALQYTTVCFLTEKSGSSISAGRVKLTFDGPISASDVIVMVEPAIGISARYVTEGGVEIDPQNAKVGQELTVTMSICDPETGALLDPQLFFGDVTQSITVNGTIYDGDTASLVLQDPDLDITMLARFSDGFTLDIHDTFSNLQMNRDITLFLSNAGKFSDDIKNLGKAEGIVVTPLVSGAGMSAEDIKSSSLTVKSGNPFSNRFSVKKNPSAGTFTIRPKAGIFSVFTPTTEQEFEIVFRTDKGEEVRDTIYVTITGDRPIILVIAVILGVLLLLALIIAYVTQTRFPRGSYIKYYTVINGRPDLENSLGKRIFLRRLISPLPWTRRHSVKGLKKIGYIPLPHDCSDLTFFARRGESAIDIAGICGKNVNGDVQLTYYMIYEDGSGVWARNEIKNIAAEGGRGVLYWDRDIYLLSADQEICIRYSTKSFDRTIGQNYAP